MKLKSFTLPALAAFLSCSATSCHNRIHIEAETAIQVPAGKSSHLDTVVYAKPMRMFTAAGEITDPAEIEAYREAHGIAGDAAPTASAQAENILSSRTERVFYGGKHSAGATAASDVIIMRQQDTGTVGTGSQGNVDAQFVAEHAFLALRNEILDMKGGITKLERIDDQNYCVRECYHLKGAVTNDALRVPYTFVATRNRLGNYPFALKAGIVPKVATGDTVLVREGFLALR